jgi:hypothetical protein
MKAAKKMSFPKAGGVPKSKAKVRGMPKMPKMKGAMKAPKAKGGMSGMY